MKSHVCPLAVLIFAGGLAIDPIPSAGEDVLEDILGNAEQEKSYEEVIYLLDTALREPVNLATAGRDEIMRLPYVSPWLADSIIAARQRGDLRGVSDLGKVGHMDPRLIKLLEPFVVVRAPEKAGPPVEGNLRLRVVADPPTDSYTKMKSFAAYNIEAASLSAGVLVEKDKEERRINDFQAYYLKKDWTSAKVVLGDFVIASGHGLVFSGGRGESPTTVDPWRFSRGQFGLRPATSSEENFMFEGLGASCERGRLGLAFAVSRSRLDAGLDSEGRIKSLGQTGLHVTRSEKEGRDALREELVGAAARCSFAASQVTLSLSGAKINRDLAVGSVRWPKDETRIMGSADVWRRSGRTITFCEVALGQGGGPALLGGIASECPGVKLLVLGRDYSGSYLSLHSRPFAFYSGNGEGEQGLFTGIVFEPSPVGSISLGNDLHRRGDRENGAFAQSGSETFADVRVEAGDFTFLVGEKLTRGEEPPSPLEAEPLALSALSGAEAGGEAAEPDQTEESKRLRTRIDIQYEPARSASFRFRFETLDATNSVGLLAARSASDLVRVDASLAPWKPLAIKAGFYAFSIGDYASRIYQYESGLPYYPQLELLKSDGSRWYCVLSFDTGGFGRIAAKFGRTLYESDEDRSELLAAYVGRF